MAQPRRRDDIPTAAAPDSKGKEVGKIEEVAIELIVARFGVEDGRERAKLGVELQWWTAFCRLDSVGVGHCRVRGWMEEVRGELARHWAQGNEAGR